MMIADFLRCLSDGKVMEVGTIMAPVAMDERNTLSG